MIESDPFTDPREVPAHSLSSAGKKLQVISRISSLSPTMATDLGTKSDASLQSDFWVPLPFGISKEIAIAFEVSKPQNGRRKSLIPDKSRAEAVNPMKARVKVARWNMLMSMFCNAKRWPLVLNRREDYYYKTYLN